MRDENNLPVTDFKIPDPAPPEVTSAYEQYRTLCGTLEELRREHTAAAKSIEDGRREDVRAMADALRAGGEASNAHTGERQARLAADESARKVEAGELAVDEALDELVTAIETCQTAWLDELGARVEDAERTWCDAILACHRSLETLNTDRCVVGWLERFEARRLRPGGASPGVARGLMFHPPASFHFRVPTAGIPGAELVNNEISAEILLDALKSGVENPRVVA